MKISIMPVGLLGTNCYLLISDKNSCAVIDPGAQPEKIAKVIKDKGLTPRYILLTHGHHDHIGGVKKLLAAFEMPLYIGQGDGELLTDDQKNRAALRYPNTDEYTINGAQLLEDGQELTLDELTIKVIATPGHTRGGVCFLCKDVIFSGDTLFRDDIGRCDLYGGDYDVMLESLQKLAALPGDYTVYPGHGENTTLEYERKNNRYINE